MKDFDDKMFEQRSDISKIKERRGEKDGIEKKFWIETENGEFLFKIDDESQYGFGELFMSHIAHKLGISCVNCYPAKDIEYTGVLVESYLSQEITRSISLAELKLKYNKTGGSIYRAFSLEQLLKMRGPLKADGIYFDKNVVRDFKRMVLMDFLLGQNDRHDSNVEFLLREGKNGKKYLSLAPMFDNGRCLGMWNFDWSPKNLAYASFPNLTISWFFISHSAEANIMMANDLASEILKDKDLKSLYKKFLELDIAKELREVADKTGYHFTNSHFLHMQEFVKERVDLVNEHINVLIESMTDCSEEKSDKTSDQNNEDCITF